MHILAILIRSSCVVSRLLHVCRLALSSSRLVILFCGHPLMWSPPRLIVLLCDLLCGIPRRRPPSRAVSFAHGLPHARPPSCAASLARRRPRTRPPLRVVALARGLPHAWSPSRAIYFTHDNPLVRLPRVVRSRAITSHAHCPPSYAVSLHTVLCALSRSGSSQYAITCVYLGLASLGHLRSFRIYWCMFWLALSSRLG